MTKQKITTFLWFDDNAEEAMNHYVSIFKSSKVLNVARYGETGPGPAGTVMVCSFRLEGQEFAALNGGPQFKFTEAISLAVHCDSQKEVDDLWAKLSKGGAPGAVRLAQGQVRLVLADRSARHDRAAAGQGSREVTTRHAGH